MPFLHAVPVTEGLWSLKCDRSFFGFPGHRHRHSGVLLLSHPLLGCSFSSYQASPVCPCVDTALILSLQLSLDPHELMLPKWGTRRRKRDPLFCGVFWAAATVCGFHGKGQRNMELRGCMNALPLCLWSK